MKKGLILLLVTVLFVGMFAGCGGSNVNDADSQVEVTTAPEAEETPVPTPDETPVSAPEPQPIIDEPQAELDLALVGTWRDDTITIFTRVFNEDGTGSRNTDEQPGGTASENPFTWRTTTNGEVILTFPWGSEEYFTYSINGNILSLTGDFTVNYVRE